MHRHQPWRQKPLADHVEFATEDVMAAVEQVVELVVRVSEVVEAVLPQAHVFELGESLIEGFDPVGAEKRRVGDGQLNYCRDEPAKGDHEE